MSTRPPRSPYSGKEPKLVIAIDVGTTCSAASYTILNPNQVPKIYNVSNFEGQEDQSGSNKTPSVIYYDSNGVLVSCGPLAIEQDESERGTKVEWFKLLLRPNSLQLDLQNAPVTQMPPESTPVRIFGDFLKYMKSCVERDLCKHFVGGKQTWLNLINSARFVLSHPNGWEGAQQAQMRTAAILGSLIPDTQEGWERIEFVSEGEASFHSCIDAGLADAALSLGSHIVIVDAGGGTIDVSSFRVTSLHPLRLEETSAAACEVEGSVFVTTRFKKTLRERLQGSQFFEEERINCLTDIFDKTTKRIFRDANAPKYIKLGSHKYNDTKYSIKSGQLMIPGDVIASAFEPSCKAAANAIRKLVDGNKNAHVFLAGGFGASPWLHAELERQLADVVGTVKHDNSNGGKAVAHGAIAYYLDRLICARVAKHTLGIPVSWEYNLLSPLHRERRKNIVRCPDSGEDILPGGFLVLVRKGEVLSDNAEYRKVFEQTTQKVACNVPLSIALIRYMGSRPDIIFRDMDIDSSFQDICRFSGVASPKALLQRQGLAKNYVSVDVTAVLSLGKTEIDCHLEWEENGEIKRGPATSVWEDI